MMNVQWKGSNVCDVVACGNPWHLGKLHYYHLSSLPNSPLITRVCEWNLNTRVPDVSVEYSVVSITISYPG